MSREGQPRKKNIAKSPPVLSPHNPVPSPVVARTPPPASTNPSRLSSPLPPVWSAPVSSPPICRPTSTAPLHHVQQRKEESQHRSEHVGRKRRACSRDGRAVGSNSRPGRARGGSAVGAPAQQQAREPHVYALQAEVCCSRE